VSENMKHRSIKHLMSYLMPKLRDKQGVPHLSFLIRCTSSSAGGCNFCHSKQGSLGLF